MLLYPWFTELFSNITYRKCSLYAVDWVELTRSRWFLSDNSFGLVHFDRLVCAAYFRLYRFCFFVWLDSIELVFLDPLIWVG